MGPGNSTDISRIGIDWAVNLGHTYDGLSAGLLRIREPGISTNIFTPSVLYYCAASQSVRSQVQLVSDSSGLFAPGAGLPGFRGHCLREHSQHKYNHAQFLSNEPVATNTDGNGIYTNISGSPFVSWIIQNPYPTTNAITNKITLTNLLIIETRNGINRTNSYPFQARQLHRHLDTDMWHRQRTAD